MRNLICVSAILFFGLATLNSSQKMVAEENIQKPGGQVESKETTTVLESIKNLAFT